MKKMFKALLGIYGLIMISVFIQGCCESRYRITSVREMKAFETVVDSNGARNINYIDTVKGVFGISTDLNSVTAMQNNLSLINTCNAFSCKINYLNSILESSLSLTLDKPITFNNVTIPANTNLLEISNSGIDVNISKYYAGLSFTFTERFLNNATIPNGVYIFALTGKTDDGADLISSAEIVLEL